MHVQENFPGFSVSPTIERITAAVAVLGGASGAAYVAAFDPAKSTFFPVCPLYAMTGFACPGCGLTRGFHALFHGDVIPALDFNLLVPFWALIFGYVGVSLMLTAIRGRGLPMWPTSPKFLAGSVIALVIFGVLRNLPWWPLTILYP